MSKEVVIIGYSGHSYVVIEIFLTMGRKIMGYCEKDIKPADPYHLEYLGNEKDSKVRDMLKDYDLFVAIGDNVIRNKILNSLLDRGPNFVNAIHPSSLISDTAIIGDGVMIGANTIINSKANLGNGVICNSACIIEHECVIKDFSHIAPGAVLCGNVHIGENTLIGANAVIIPNIKIGNNTTIGAGTKITQDVDDNKTIK